MRHFMLIMLLGLLLPVTVAQAATQEPAQRIKDLAIEEHIPILLLSQLNRDIEKRTDSKDPRMSDLRDSGVLEQAADIVIFINRPEQQGKTKDVNGESLAGIGFLKVAKNRNGSTGITRFRYNENMTRLSDY